MKPAWDSWTFVVEKTTLMWCVCCSVFKRFYPYPPKPPWPLKSFLCLLTTAVGFTFFVCEGRGVWMGCCCRVLKYCRYGSLRSFDFRSLVRRSGMTGYYEVFVRACIGKGNRMGL